MLNKKLYNQIFGNKQGYKVIDLNLNLINLVKNFICDSIKKNIEYDSEYINKIKSFEDCVEFLESGKLTLSRDNRTIEKKQVRDSSPRILDFLEESIKRPTHLVNDDLYYRVVRKFNRNEISLVHRDIYFHNILDDWTPSSKVFNSKLWIPLFQKKDQCLGVIPGSHEEKKFNDVNYIFENKKKVGFKCDFTSNDLTPITVKYGQALLFPSTLVHGSLPVNQLKSLRISAEFTLGYYLS